jgi:uncharacterized protein (TIGR02145 family)
MKKPNLFITLLVVCVLFITGCNKNNLAVNYDANGGVGTMPAQNFERDEPQALLPNAFVCEGYWFKGWNTTPDGSAQKYANQQIISIQKDMTLFAQWRTIANTFYVLFYANGGTGTMENQAFIEDERQELTPNRFIRSGNIFTGWNTKTDGSGYQYRDKEWIYLEANLALHAQWTNSTGGGTPCQGTPTVKDVAGNTYNTVQIGSQCWLKENLRTTKYNNGEVIPMITNNEQWYNLENGAMCYYNNDPENAKTYGALYNGYTLDEENLCPTGWHVPSAEECDILANNLGGANEAGYKMKTVYDWASGWGYENGNGSNESGFSALPAGFRVGPVVGYFMEMGYETVFWSSTESYYWGKTTFRLKAGRNELSTPTYGDVYGLSVRCVKD